MLFLQVLGKHPLQNVESSVLLLVANRFYLHTRALHILMQRALHSAIKKSILALVGS